MVARTNFTQNIINMNYILYSHDKKIKLFKDIFIN